MCWEPADSRRSASEAREPAVTCLGGPVATNDRNPHSNIKATPESRELHSGQPLSTSKVQGRGSGLQQKRHDMQGWSAYNLHLHIAAEAWRASRQASRQTTYEFDSQGGHLAHGGPRRDFSAESSGVHGGGEAGCSSGSSGTAWHRNFRG